jgi:hypothetical protein
VPVRLLDGVEEGKAKLIQALQREKLVALSAEKSQMDVPFHRLRGGELKLYRLQTVSMKGKDHIFVGIRPE